MFNVILRLLKLQKDTPVEFTVAGEGLMVLLSDEQSLAVSNLEAK